MIGLWLDPVTHDVATDTNGALRMATDAEAVAQHVKQRLLAHEGEWFLDTTAGVPWFGQIMGQQFDAEVAEALVKAEAVDTPGVTEIDSLSARFNKATRGLILEGFTVRTQYDEDN